jgi:hypothetical protein
MALFGKPFNGDDLFSAYVFYRSLAGRDAFAIEQHGACAAIAFATAVFRAGELKLLAQDIKQCSIGIGGDGPGLSVDVESDAGCHIHAG